MAVPPAEEMKRPPPKKAKCKTLKHHLDNKKRGGEALAYLQSIKGRTLNMEDISRINEIVQSEKNRRFLPKAAKELLDTIFLNANENQRAQLLWLV